MDRPTRQNGASNSQRRKPSSIDIPARVWLLGQGEHILFNTSIECTAPKRRASRLLAMAVAPKKVMKTRDLILTNQRLVCIKRKPSRSPQIRVQVFVKPCEKEKDGRNIISGVEPKGEREFVVMTVSTTRWTALVSY